MSDDRPLIVYHPAGQKKHAEQLLDAIKAGQFEEVTREIEGLNRKWGMRCVPTASPEWQ